jgi:hypothetical protein
MLMPLYTFIMEFEGGTYISQVKASSPKSACVKWAESLDASGIYRLSEAGKSILVEEMKNVAPTAIKGVLNTWFSSALILGKSANINLVQTVEYQTS